MEARVIKRQAGKDGKWGRCQTCGQFVGAIPTINHYQHKGQ